MTIAPSPEHPEPRQFLLRDDVPVDVLARGFLLIGLNQEIERVKAAIHAIAASSSGDAEGDAEGDAGDAPELDVLELVDRAGGKMGRLRQLEQALREQTALMFVGIVQHSYPALDEREIVELVDHTGQVTVVLHFFTRHLEQSGRLSDATTGDSPASPTTPSPPPAPPPAEALVAPATRARAATRPR